MRPNKTVKRRSVVFLISDFQDAGYEHTLRLAEERRHDVIPVVVSDQRELTIPNVGLVELQDQETGQTVFLDTSSRAHRELYRNAPPPPGMLVINYFFKRLRLDAIRISTGGRLRRPATQIFSSTRGSKMNPSRPVPGSADTGRLAPGPSEGTYRCSACCWRPLARRRGIRPRVSPAVPPSPALSMPVGVSTRVDRSTVQLLDRIARPLWSVRRPACKLPPAAP